MGTALLRSKFVLGIAIALSLFVAAWYLSSIRPPASTLPTETSTSTAHTLLDENRAYAEAYALESEGKYEEARARYEDALEGASPEDESQIKLKIAHATRDEGDLLQAAHLYKEIAGNTTYPAEARATAIQSLGLLDLLGGDPAVRAETFRGEPYASFLVPDDYRLSYRHLYEYASSFHPLALSELMIAEWYAITLARVRLTNAIIDPQLAVEYQYAAEEHLKKAEADMLRTANDPVEVSTRLYMEFIHAAAISQMALAGYGSHAAAEERYKELLSKYSTSGIVNDGFIRYHYATYLSVVRGRNDDIVSLLQPISADPAYAASSFGSFLASERDNRLGHKKRMQRLADIDPAFKAILVSLGWTTADFAS